MYDQENWEVQNFLLKIHENTVFLQKKDCIAHHDVCCTGCYWIGEGEPLSHSVRKLPGQVWKWRVLAKPAIVFSSGMNNNACQN